MAAAALQPTFRCFPERKWTKHPVQIAICPARGIYGGSPVAGVLPGDKSNLPGYWTSGNIFRCVDSLQTGSVTATWRYLSPLCKVKYQQFPRYRQLVSLSRVFPSRFLVIFCLSYLCLVGFVTAFSLFFPSLLSL